MPANSLLATRSARRAWRFLPTLALAFAGLASAADDIQVVDTRGDVRIAEGGTERAAKAGVTLALPSALISGSDGWADLRQGATTLGVGPNTRLEFPAADQPSANRVVQPRGTAFYNVAGRGSRMRVETPYLVAVIKGTQFNVVVEAEASTISLFEGSLEVRATEGDAVVLLAAGEIATRRRGEDGIRVIRMKDGAVAVVKADGARKDADGKGGGTAADADGAGTPGTAIDVDLDDPVKGLPIDPVEGKVTAGAKLSLEGPPSAEFEVATALSVGETSVTAGAAAGLDLGAGTVDTSVDVGADAGPAAADVGADLAADVGAGTVDAAVDAGLDLGVAEVDAGVDVGVDLTGSDAGLDVGLDLLGAEVDVGLDLGGGSGGSGGGTGSESEQSGVLGGLLRRTGL